MDALVLLSLVLVFTKSDLYLEDEVTQVLSRDVASFTASRVFQTCGKVRKASYFRFTPGVRTER